MQLVIVEVFILPQDVQKAIQSHLNFAAFCQAQTVAISRFERVGADLRQGIEAGISLRQGQ